MSTSYLEAIQEDEDELTPRERELEAYHRASAHLDPESVQMTACAKLSCQRVEAIIDLVKLQLREPYEDITHARIHDSLAQQVTQAVLAAVAECIDEQAVMVVMGQR